MDEASAIALVYAAIWTIIAMAGPAVLAAMVVGIVIALFQALTQVQEVTLTFIPKVIVVLLVLVISAPFIGSQILAFATETYAHISTGF
jgi:flagellar biosynthetic protein FliQ